MASTNKRFLWAHQEVDQTVQKISDKSRRLLVALAESAPDEVAGAYFAAGPLEDYINLIVKKKDAKEGRYILSTLQLKVLLQYVWGDIDKLDSVAVSDKHYRNA